MPFITQGKTNWKFLLIVVVLVAIVGGGILAYQYWWSPKEEAKNHTISEAKVKEISIQKPNLVITGENLSEVQVYMVPTGTGINPETMSLIKNATKQSENNGEQVWIYQYPENLLITNIFAKGFDNNGNLVGKIDLPIIGATALWNALYENTDETADWQTYSGVYSISFIYPHDLKSSEGDADLFSIIRLWNPLGDDNDSEFSIKMPYQSSAAQTIQDLQKNGFTIEKESTIDGFPATQLKGTSAPSSFVSPCLATNVVVRVGNQVYEIINWRAGENDAVFQKILDSIEFTDWQTYRNEEYGFEIKYPKDTRVLETNNYLNEFDYTDGNKILIIESPTNSSGQIAGIEMSVDGTESGVSDCPTTTTKNINGISFFVWEENFTDYAMAGERMAYNRYKVVHNNMCYSVFSYVDWRDVETVDMMVSGKEPSTQELKEQQDRIQTQQQLDSQILSTFRFLE